VETGKLVAGKVQTNGQGRKIKSGLAGLVVDLSGGGHPGLESLQFFAEAQPRSGPPAQKIITLTSHTDFLSTRGF
jgi:hypothetical protein